MQGRCECDDGWGGESCEAPQCSEGCGHGRCTQPGECTCWAGWASAKGMAPCKVDLLADRTTAAELLQGLDPREGAPALLMHRAGSVRPLHPPCSPCYEWLGVRTSPV